MPQTTTPAETPLVMMYRIEHGVRIHTELPKGYTTTECAAHICALVEDVAALFDCSPDLIWDAIEDERSNPSLAWKNTLTT
jgi:hypothetical protein